MKVFLDSDGVLCAFDAHVMQFSGGKSPRELGNEALWALVNSIPDFWLTMPLMPGARDLVAAAKRIDPDVCILTGCPRTGYEVAAEQKPIKLGAYFPGVRVITCLSRHKPQYMEKPGDVLVDDFIVNVRRWERAGGTAIHYWNAAQAIHDLNQIAAERGF